MVSSRNNHLVIMAGGVGSRFWPMSTVEKPKQFIDVLGVGKSLLQLTVERFGDICKTENVWVVTNKAYIDLVREQLPELTHYGYDGATNYCRANKVYERELMKRAKALCGLTGVRGRVERTGDLIWFYPYGSNTVLIID